MELITKIDNLLQSFPILNAPTGLMGKVLEKSLEATRRPYEMQDGNNCFRAGSIGKPWVLQVLNRWFPSESQFNLSSLMVMTDGIIMQAWVEQALELGGFKFESETELRLRDGIVVGHSDIIVLDKDEEEVVVLECKSMGGHLVSKFVNAPHDDYGYVSQLSFYTSCAKQLYPNKTVHGVFVIYDRSSAKFKLVELMPSIVQAKFTRITQAVDTIAAIKPLDFEELLEVVGIPPIVNGKIPTSMKWSKWAPCFYRQEGKEYVMYEKAEQLLLLRNFETRMGML